MEEAATEEAASLEAASEDAASEDAASEDAASLEAASEEAETEATEEAADSAVEEAAVEEEPPQAVIPTARTRAATTTATFLSFIFQNLLTIQKIHSRPLTGGVVLQNDILVRLSKKSRAFRQRLHSQRKIHTFVRNIAQKSRLFWQTVIFTKSAKPGKRRTYKSRCTNGAES